MLLHFFGIQQNHNRTYPRKKSDFLSGKRVEHWDSVFKAINFLIPVTQTGITHVKVIKSHASRKKMSLSYWLSWIYDLLNRCICIKHWWAQSSGLMNLLRPLKGKSPLFWFVLLTSYISITDQTEQKATTALGIEGQDDIQTTRLISGTSKHQISICRAWWDSPWDAKLGVNIFLGIDQNLIKIRDVTKRPEEI